tara:strand:+ start:423 stop:830 length:408 start_codon:yes stop_codon:yes gene_type:complete
MKVKGRVQAIRSIRQQFSDVADPHKREKLINAAMKKSKIKLSALGEIFEFEGFNPNGKFIPLPDKGKDHWDKKKIKDMRQSVARDARIRRAKIMRRGAYGAAVGVGLGAGSLLGNAINRRRKRKDPNNPRYRNIK